MLTSLGIQPQGPPEAILFATTLTTTSLAQAEQLLAQQSVDVICLQLLWPEPQWLRQLWHWQQLQQQFAPIVVVLPERWRSRYKACIPVMIDGEAVRSPNLLLALHTLNQITAVWRWLPSGLLSTAQSIAATQELLRLDIPDPNLEAIVAQVQAQPLAALHQSVNPFIEHLINTIDDPVFVKDQHHRWIFLNNALCEFVGIDKDILLGQSDYAFFPKAEADVFWEQDDLVFQTEQVNKNEEQITDRQGITHTIQTQKSCFVHPNGQKLLTGIIEDVTENRQNQAKIQQQQDYLTAIFEVQWLMLRCQKSCGEYYSTVVKQLGRASGASRVYIFENHYNPQGQLCMSQKAEWCDVGIIAELDNPIYQNMPYRRFGSEFGATLARQEVVSSLVADLPKPMRDILNAHGILAILVLPILVKGEFFGFIGFDNCREAILWSQTEVYLLQTVATTIAITQERLQLQHQYQQVVETTHEAICLLNLQGEVEFANQQMYRLLDPHYHLSATSTSATLVGELFIEWVLPDYQARIAPYLSIDPDSEKSIHFNCPLQRQDGSIVWTTVAVTLRQDQEQRLGLLLMLTDISEGYNTKRALQQRLEIEQLVTSLSTQFMNVQSSNLDDCINQALQQIGDFIGVDRSYVFRVSANGETISNSHEWCTSGVQPSISQLQNLPFSVFPWAIPKLQKGELLYIPDVEDLPAAAAFEQAQWRAEGIQSLMCVPMMLRGKFMGLVGVDAVRSPQLLVKTSLNLLRLVAEIFVGALERRRIEQELQYRLQLEQVIATISTRFIQLPTSEIMGGIRLALEQIGQFSRADRACVYQIVEPKPQIQKLYAWHRDDLTVYDESLSRFEIPWLIEQLNQHPVIHLPTLDILPPEAVTERRYWQDSDIQSMLIVPMISQGELLGFVEFDGVRSPQTWSNSTITLLRLVGEMFANALHRRKIESAIQQSQERFEQLTENINSIFWMTDLDKQTMLYISPAYEKVLGKSCASLYAQPRSFLDAIHPDDRDRVVAAFPQQVQGTYDEEYRMIRVDGQVRWVSDRAFPVINEAGEVYRIAGITEDITERKLNEQVKDEFISTLSHELRTPLTSLMVALKLLHQTPTLAANEQIQKLLTIAVNNSDRLGDLIQNLLDVQNLTSGDYNFNDQLIPLPQLLEKTIVMPTSEHRLNILLLPDNLTTIELRIDPEAITKVFRNLLSNSVKFSPAQSEITLGVQRQANSVCFRLQDQGVGIEPEQLSQIFEMFRQGDSSDTRRYGGVGLGLYICRRIVEHYGGEIWAQSTVGQGSCFYFTLPIWKSKS
ncbi:MAG: PAS domain S-box protein [Spirulina sp. SIO3F2]|nr:PAS domain S-box protein [Spirulina sp. SIO3F2]